MTQAKGKRRGQGEDSIYWDSSKNRYVGAVSLGFNPAGTRIRRKVTGRTKAEVRGKLRGELKPGPGLCAGSMTAAGYRDPEVPG